MRIRIDLAYDGTDFHGWATQPRLRTVQGELEAALATALRLPEASVVCAGRTDTGVHARGQVAHLDVEETVLADFGVETAFVPRERLSEEIGSDAYHGGLAATEAGLLHPGKYFAGLANAAARSGADLHEGVRASGVRRQADGRFVVVY